MYSLDDFLTTPLLSIVFSLFLVFGIDFIGLFAIKKIQFIFSEKINNLMRFQSPILGISLLSIFLSPLALLNLMSLRFMKITAICISLLGLIQFTCHIKKIFSIKITLKKILIKFSTTQILERLIFAILVGFFLITLGPSTNADSLDYALGGSIAILQNSGFPYVPEWFSERIIGNGEIFTAIGLSIGAEQFSSLIQYISLLSVFSIFFFLKKDIIGHGNIEKQESLNLILLAFVSTPLLFSIIGSQKFIMWPIALIFLAFFLILMHHKKKQSYINKFIFFTFICLLLMTASMAKFNFRLSSLVVYIISLFFMLRKNFLIESIVISLLTALIIIGPFATWNIYHYTTDIFGFIFEPLPGNLPGTKDWIDFAKNNPDVNSIFKYPFNIMLPDSFQAYTTILGVGSLILINLEFKKEQFIANGMIAPLLILGLSFFFIPPAGRYYLEPYLWFILILFLQSINNKMLFQRWIKYVVMFQAITASLILLYSVLVFLPGSFSKLEREKVMSKFANGYTLSNWVNKVAPKNAILLYTNRSMSLAPRKALSADWLDYVDVLEPQSRIYLDRLKFAKVSHILIMGPIDLTTPLAGCYGNITAGPFIGETATRNIFSKKYNFEAWLVEFRSNDLPDCVYNHIHKKVE